MSTEKGDVLLLFMPFGNINSPSLALSLLKAGLNRRNISAQVEYCNLDFAETIGSELYLLLSSYPQLSFLAEWVFSYWAFCQDGSDKEVHNEVLLKLLKEKELAAKRVGRPDVFPVDLQQKLVEARDKAETFVDSCVDLIERVRPRILGLSTMFAQNCSSLAVARRVKQRLGADAPVVILGGSNCEGIMGYTILKAFPWIDYVCCGEGDGAFVEFVSEVLNDRPPHVKGILGHNENRFDNFSTPEPVIDMDGLPIPDFEDYFTRQLAQKERNASTFLTIETSRGCWWGEKSHCTFCGLNGLTIRYRSKAPERILQELDYVVKKYGPLRFHFTDNILNPDLFHSFFPELIRKRMKLDMLFETKSNLNREQLRLLKEGGTHRIQPGIESLSDDTLRLMRKGVSGLQNVWLLKCCREMGIEVSWNWLCGFPGEKASEYERMRHWAPLLHHLQPPGRFGPIHLDRFSPLFNLQRESGIRHVRASSPYQLIYPLDDSTLYDLAYYFEFDYEDGRSPQEYIGGLADEILNWMIAWNMERRIVAPKPLHPALRRPIAAKLTKPISSMLGAPVPAMYGAPILAMLDLRVGTVIWDTRDCASRTLCALKGLEAGILRYVADIRRHDLVVQHFVGLGYNAVDIENALANLVENKIVLVDSGRCLALVPRATVSMILAAVFAMSLRALRKLQTYARRSRKASVTESGI
jgi:ribosomal peptide maturation radical SAM protein 1